MATAYSVANTAIIDTNNYLYNLAIFEKKVAMTDSNFNLYSGNFFTKTASGNLSFSANNVPATGNVAGFVLELTNGGTYTMNWSGMGTVQWVGGAAAQTAPYLTATGTDVISFYTHNGGSTWKAFIVGRDVK